MFQVGAKKNTINQLVSSVAEVLDNIHNVKTCYSVKRFYHVTVSYDVKKVIIPATHL